MVIRAIFLSLALAGFRYKEELSPTTTLERNFCLMKIVRTLLAVLTVTLIATHASFAVPVPVPEIDPGMGAGALALISGAILVIRGRKS